MDQITYRPTLVVIFGILGFLVALAFNTAQGMANVRPERVSDLVGLVRTMELQRNDLQDRLSELRGTMGALEREAAAGSGLSESFSRELAEARAIAGLTGVRGPGLELVLADGTDVSPGTDPNDYLIHDTDLSAVVNALFAGGAEAIDINGERIVATTPVRCAGTTILVNSVRLGSPYTLRAVGNPLELESAVRSDPSASLLFDVYQKQFGLRVSITKADRVEVSGYRGSLRPGYLLTDEGSPQ